MSSDSTPTVRVSNETNVRMPLYFLLGLIGVCIGGAVAWANVSGQVADIPAIKTKLEAHEAQLTKLAVMANDIEWMRRYMEQTRPRPQPQPSAGNPN